jgi:hypothetical protein
MNIIEAIKKAKADDWKDALYWFIWTIALSMMPLWILILFLKSMSQPISLDSFAGNGEFALYSAGILSGAVYVVTREMKPDASVFKSRASDLPLNLINRLRITFPNSRLLYTVSALLVLVSAVVFSLTTLADLLTKQTSILSIDKPFIVGLTLIVFGISMVLSFLITVVNNASMKGQDLLDMQREPLDTLKDQFDEILDD